MSPDELRYYYALYLCDGIGAQRLIALRTYFGDAERAFKASAKQLEKTPGFGPNLAEQCVASKTEALETAENHLGMITQDISILTFFDQAYPETLRNIFNPPALLFYSGNIDLLSSDRNIAVIGTRTITDYGRRITTELCKTFAQHSVTVTSGFATGVDTVAHRAVFDAGGSTIAVLGSGINVIYPASNKSFAKELITSGRGLIVSELAYGARPDAKNFPWRNRIVSGLASASVIIESDDRGGSMITASITLDQNREVFALPGDVDRPMSRGPNLLLSENRARPFRSAVDILKAMEWLDSDSKNTQKPKKNNRVGLSAIQEQLVAILDLAGEPIYIDAVVERSGVDVQTALVQLLELEFNDVIRQLPGKHFSTIF